MGVASTLTLPGNVRFDDLCRVLRRLYGNPSQIIRFEPMSLGPAEGNLLLSTPCAYESQAYRLKVEVGDVVPSDSTQKDSDGSSWVPCDRFFWSFEGDSGTRYMHRNGEDPWTVSVFVALADFFGGRVDFNDSDDSDVDHEVDFKGHELNCPTEGQFWSNLEARIKNVQPLQR